MESESLPSEFDAVILGTGVSESIVAAALSRIGLRVLHLDRCDSYGGDWASYNFTALQHWITSKTSLSTEDSQLSQSDLNKLLDVNEQLICLPTTSSTVSNVSQTRYVSDETVGLQQESCHESSSTHCHTGQQQSTPNRHLVPDSHAKPCIQPEEDRDGKPCIQPEEDRDGKPCLQPEEDGDARPRIQPDEDRYGKLYIQPEEDRECKPCLQPEKDRDARPRIQPDEDEHSKSSSSKSTSDTHNTEIGKQWCFADIKKLWRKFNIDLMPKLLYCRGSLVELLISSDVAKYCEFRSVTRILTLIGDKLEQVPCSRADVFASHTVGVVEKRMLMKLLSFCLEYDKNPSEYAGFEDKPFAEFLNSKNLTATVRHYVQHAIAMATHSTSTIEGLHSTQKFLQSLGRYGNTAFLWPLYGSGELPQCFCRMCAVFGGIYCLRRQAVAAILDSDNKLVGVIESKGQRINTKWLVMEASYASPDILSKTSVSRISRGVLITDSSIKCDKQQHITLLNLPLPGSQDVCVKVCELSSDSFACPDGLYVVHLTCRSVALDAQSDLQPVVDMLFQSSVSDDTKPNVLWSLYFNVDNTSHCDLHSAVDNILIVGGPDECLDYHHSVAQARRIFEKMCPGEEFLPKAPNPEDIIYDDGESVGQGQSGFESREQTTSHSEP